MIRRAFDNDGDYAINTLIQGSAATIQAVATRLRLLRGEWFLNINDGVPWYQRVFVKPANTRDVEKAIRDTITQTEGVAAITSFNLTFNSATRRVSVAFSATTIYGDEFTDEDIAGLNPLGA